MSKLRIKDAQLLPDVDGSEKIPTGGRGDLAISMEQVKTFAQGGLPQQINAHVNNAENPHSVTKTQVGLGNVDNTSDLDKPVSTAQQEALNLKADKVTTYTKIEVDSRLGLKADKTAVHSKSATLPTYYIKEDGVNSVTGVVNGAYFNVRSTDDATMLDEYQNVGGVAIATGKRYLSAIGVQLQEKAASTIVDESGKNQQELNNALKQAFLDRLNVRDFGAILDGTEHKLSEKFSTLTMAQVVYPFATSLSDTLDFCAYQAAIDYATTKGFNTRPVQGNRTGRGAIVYAPSGQAVINRPLIMPRSGNFDGASVYIEGETVSSSAIAATSTFPAGRALIEWEDSAQRTYWQGVRNIAFRLPDVFDTKAIWFKKSSTCIAGGSTTSLIFAEYMHGLKLEHITVEGSNSYHKNCIQFDGYVRFSKFDHLISNLGLGPDPIYNTIYLQFASDYGTSSVIKGESNGVAYSEINNIWGMGQRGGNGVLIKGRFLESSGKNWINGNGTTDATPAFEINNSYIFNLSQTGSEGRIEKPQYLIKNSIGVNLESVGLGGLDGDGGVGVKFEACESCTLNGRYATPSDPSFSSKNGKAVIIDANCINVKVSNFYISANPELEFEILAPLSAGNSIEWIRASTKAQGTYLAGGSAGMKDIVIATKNAAQAVPPESEFTLITWPNVQLDTNSKMNGATGEYTAGKISTVRVSGGFTILNAVVGQSYEVNVAVNGLKSDRLAYITAATEGAIFLPFDKIVRITAASQRVGVGINNASTTTAINIGQYNTLGNFSVEEIA